MAGGKSDFLEAAILARHFGLTAYTPPATCYFALFTDVNTQAQRDAGTVTEVSGSNYSRASLTNNTTNFPAPTGTSPTTSTNGTAITWPVPSATWGRCTAVGIYDAATTGNLLWWMDLLGAEVVGTVATSGNLVTAPAHGFTVDQPVKFSKLAGVAVPGGLTDGAYYYVRSPTTDTFTVSLTAGGAAITITTSGGGMFGLDLSQTPGAGATVSVAISALTLTED